MIRTLKKLLIMQIIMKMKKRVEMLKSGVVNGRFPEGVVIDVNKSDADNLEDD